MLAGKDIVRFRDSLLAMRDRILALRKNLNACLYDLQFPDAEFEFVTQGSLQQDSREKDELEAIDRALQKMEKGRYGICESCGAAIALKRLEILPATGICFACATNMKSGRKERLQPKSGYRASLRIHSLRDGIE